MVKFPNYVQSESKLVCITTEVIDADIPLLLGASSLSKAEAVMDIGKLRLSLPGVLGQNSKSLPLRRENSGHFSFEMFPPSNTDAAKVRNAALDSFPASKAASVILHATEEDKGGSLTKKQVVKLHHYFGHAHADKIRGLIKKAGRWNKEVEAHIKSLEKCEICLIHRPKQPRPTVSLPRASRFNEILTLDLKENNKYPNSPPYILYYIPSVCSQNSEWVFSFRTRRQQQWQKLS